MTVTAVARWEKAEQKGGRKPAAEALLCLLRVTGIPAEGLLFPERYLDEHPTISPPGPQSHNGGADHRNSRQRRERCGT